MQAFFAWEIMSLITKDLWIKFFGAGLLAFAPAMLWRVNTPSGTHAALTAHFLILAAILLVFRKRPIKINYFWVLLLCIAVLTHFYLFFIVGMIWMADLFDRMICQRSTNFKNFVIEILIAFIAVLLCAWQAGYFLIGPSSGTEKGYGFFKLNLLSPFNPEGWSYILPNIQIPTSWGEGFNYLGLGGILLVIFLPIILLLSLGARKKQNKLGVGRIILNHVFLILCLAIFFIDALTNKIGIGMLEIEYDIPAYIQTPLEVLRSSARLYWPIHYSLILAAIYLVVKFFPKRIALAIVSIAFIIQVADTEKGWSSTRRSISQDVTGGNYTPDLSNVFWNNAASHYKKIILIPATSQSPKWIQFATLSAIHGLQTNSVFFARPDIEKLEESNKKLLRMINDGDYDSQALYIIERRLLIPILETVKPSDLIANLDRFYILAPAWMECKDCIRVPSKYQITLNDLSPVVDSPIGFSKKEKDWLAPYYLESGWSWQEDWGVWSDGDDAVLNLPRPKTSPKSVTLNFNAFLVHKLHEILSVDVWVNGLFYRNLQLSQYEGNRLEIPISKQMLKKNFLKIEFKLQNPVKPIDLISDNKDVRMLGIGLVSAEFE